MAVKLVTTIKEYTGLSIFEYNTKARGITYKEVT